MSINIICFYFAMPLGWAHSSFLFASPAVSTMRIRSYTNDWRNDWKRSWKQLVVYFRDLLVGLSFNFTFIVIFHFSLCIRIICKLKQTKNKKQKSDHLTFLLRAFLMASYCPWNPNMACCFIILCIAFQLCVIGCSLPSPSFSLSPPPSPHSKTWLLPYFRSPLKYYLFRNHLSE